MSSAGATVALSVRVCTVPVCMGVGLLLALGAVAGFRTRFLSTASFGWIHSPPDFWSCCLDGFFSIFGGGSVLEISGE